MNIKELIGEWESEERRKFEGWDFAHLEGRMIEEKEPWDYLARAACLLDGASSMLDMDTGGGERLLELRGHWPRSVVATEEYPPNLRLATKRLTPLGVDVVDVHVTDVDPLPFGDCTFDVVLNRHSAFNADEIARILVPGGKFLTQQVHGMYAWDLLECFGAEPTWPETTGEKYVPRLEASGLSVDEYVDWQGTFEFTDVGAIVYYLKAVAWYIPDFSVAAYRDDLLALQERLERGDRLIFEARKYLIEASKPEAASGQRVGR